MSTVPLSQAKTNLAKLLAEVEQLGEEVIITRSGRPVGVLLSVIADEGLLETSETWADRDCVKLIEQGLAEAVEGNLLSHKDVWDGLDARPHGQCHPRDKEDGSGHSTAR